MELTPSQAMEQMARMKEPTYLFRAFLGICLIGAGAVAGSLSFPGAWLICAALLTCGGVAFGIALPGRQV